MLLDDDRVARQLDDFVVGQRIAVAFGHRHIDGAHGAAFGTLGVEFHLDQLGADAAADDGIVAAFERRLEDVELVRVDGALHHRLAQAVRRGDEHHVLEARLGVDGEHHAGAALVGTDHALDAGRQRDLGVGVALVHAIRNGAVVVQRGENVADLVEHVVDAHHVEEGLLLAGERSVGQVFGGRRGAHRERALAVGVELGECGADRLFEFRRERRIDHPLTDLRAGAGQLAYVFGVEGGETVSDALVQTGSLQEVPEGLGGRGKAAGHAYPRAGQLTDHFT
ncbi:Uncharacterised protein [Bordetella pertussis]|nr:Uncharacterised protein [Bordetella pertussis]